MTSGPQGDPGDRGDQSALDWQEEEIMITITDPVTLRDLARDHLGVYGSDPRFVEVIEAMTVIAMGLGVGPMAAGTGGAYADVEVTGGDATIILDMILNCDPVTGQWNGNRDSVAALAAE